MLELVLVFVLGGVPFIKAGGRDYAALEGDTAAKHRLFRHRFGAAINEIVSAHPECSETTITYDYEDGHTWASYWLEVLAVFAVHTNLNSDSDVVVINAAQIRDISKRTALYERLSKDDEQQGESNSILNQKQYLEEYAHRNGFVNIQHFTDDGYTGRNFTDVR